MPASRPRSTRTTFFLWVLALSLAQPFDRSVAQTSAPTGWPQFRGDARLTGVAPGALPDKLTLKWTYEAGDIIESSAAIAEGTVYVGAGTGDLLAIDLDTGKLRWKYATGSQIGE